MGMVANNDSNNGHNNQQTIRVNDYEKMVFDGGGGQGQQWWQWCLIAAAKDDNKAVAMGQMQREGRTNQMKIMFDGSGGRGRLMAARMENSEAMERSGGDAIRLGGSDRTRARSECNVGGQELQRSIGVGTGGWELEVNKPNGGRRASDSHSLAFLPIVLRRWLQQPAREQERYGKRRWQCVRILLAGASDRRM